MKLTIVIGGANSGKTAFALELLNKHKNKYFIATAQAFDPEMSHKIDQHKLERRDMNVFTIEEPLNLNNIWPTIEEDGVVLLDCLTLWGTNQIYKNTDLASKEEILESLKKHFDKSSMKFKELIIVTNEIGMGGINLSKEARITSSLLGMINQSIGKICDEAWIVLCGMPKRWK